MATVWNLSFFPQDSQCGTVIDVNIDCAVKLIGTNCIIYPVNSKDLQHIWVSGLLTWLYGLCAAPAKCSLSGSDGSVLRHCGQPAPGSLSVALAWELLDRRWECSAVISTDHGKIMAALFLIYHRHLFVGCVGVFCMHIVYVPLACLIPKEGIGSPGTEVTERTVHKPPCGGWEWNPGPQQEQTVL